MVALTDRRGLTLVEMLIAAAILAVAITAILGAYFMQVALTEHSRNMAWGANDASRVMERLRQQNTGGACTTPSAAAPGGFASWDVWLADATANGGGGKSIQPNPNTNELVVVTPTGVDPMTLTVAVCWRQRNQTWGECTWNGASLVPNPAAGSNPAVTESPIMLATLMTCRR